MASNQSASVLDSFSPMQTTAPEPTSLLQKTGLLLVFSSTALAVGITALRIYAKGRGRQFWWGKCFVETKPQCQLWC